VALLFVAVWGPSIVLAPVAGALVDRFETRRVLGVVSLAQVLVAVALVFSSSTWAILVLATLLGSGFAIAQPAEFALVPAVAGERLADANGLVETARYIGFALGPLLGGILSSVGGIEAAMLVNAGTFVAVAFAALVIRAERRPEALGEPRGERARDGIVFLFRDRTLGLVVGVAFVSLLFMTASAPAEVFFAVDVLEVGSVGFGALMTSWTVGMALGALVLARRFAGALAAAAIVAIVVQSVGLALPTLWLVFAFALVSYFVGGAAHGTKNVLIRTLIHERVPARLHGRAYAAYNGLRNSAELVAIMGGGVLVAVIGARWTLFVAGALPAAAGATGLLVYRRMRLEEPVRAATPLVQ
jgi:MFS family permease